MLWDTHLRLAVRAVRRLPGATGCAGRTWPGGAVWRVRRAAEGELRLPRGITAGWQRLWARQHRAPDCRRHAARGRLRARVHHASQWCGCALLYCLALSLLLMCGVQCSSC